MKISSEKFCQFIFAAFTIGLPLGCGATSIPTGTWVEEAPYPVSNYTVGSATVNGSIYVFGVDGTTTISTTEIYNPTTNTWTSAPGMPTPRAVSGAAAVGTVIYVVGGQTNVAEVATVEAFNTLTNTWSTATPMPQPLERMAVVSANGYLYTLGGCLTFTCGGSDTNLVQQFDPVTQMWTVKSSMSTPRRDFAAGVLNGIIYATGGIQGPCCGGPVLSSVEAYNPVTDTWSTVASMSTGREEHAAAVVNGLLYVVGGRIGTQQGVNETITNSVEAYDPVANMWASVPAMPTSRVGLTASAAGSTLYAIGGSNQSGFTPENEAFIIFAFATSKGASFVIGDLEAGLGNHVTWWSRQWAQINLMSGGAPPNAMKGFAGFEDNFLGLPPPNCGGTWSTDPGNSAPPPPTVPQVMGVIVSSKVTQAGSIISGDIKQVVVVRNDPGYAPDPSHPGTGTEIGIVCTTP